MRLIRTLPLLFFFILGFTRTAAAADVDIGGSWIGVYQTYPYLMRMTFDIPRGQRAQGSVEVQLRIEGLSPKDNVSQGIGVASATVEFDTAAGTLTVRPGANAYRQFGGRLPTFVGVYDSQRKYFGGVLMPGATDASPYFVLATRDVAPAAFLDRLQDFTGRGFRSAGPGLPFKFGGLNKSKEAKVRAWAQQFINEYPDVDAYNMQQGGLYLMARNLFQDESFRPHFGVTYDSLDGGDAQPYWNFLRQAPPPRGNFPEERVNGVMIALERPFSFNWPSTFAPPDIVLSTMGMRAISGWRAQSLARMAAAPANLESWQVYQAAESTAAEVLALGWPSQSAAFAEGIAAARARTADPLLEQRVADVLASGDVARINDALAAIRDPRMPAAPAGRPNNRAAMRAPAPAASTNRNTTELSLQVLAGYASAGVRQAQDARLGAGVANAAASECDSDRAMVARMPSTGLPALQAAGNRYQELERKYSALRGVSRCAALDDLRALQQTALASAEPELTAMLQSAANSSDVARIRSSYLAVADHRSDGAGARLMQLAAQRDGEFNRQAQVVAEQHAEQRKLAGCASTSTETENGEPSERDMCTAFSRALSGQSDALNGMKDSCGNVNGNTGAAMACLLGGAMELGGGVNPTVSYFEKIACVSAAAAGKPGFFCDYGIKVSMGNATLDAFGSGFGAEASTARFVKSRGTWIVIPKSQSN